MPESNTILDPRLKLEKDIFEAVREVPDFPKAGIMFKDINPMLRDHDLSKNIILHLKEYYSQDQPDVIIGIESRGFFFGFPLALALGVPFVPVRKKGKLPGELIEQTYDLEYGTATMEIQSGVIPKGAKVLIHDDVLATGGTACAAAELVKKCEAQVFGFNSIIELSFLKGVNKVKSHTSNIYNLATS